MFLFIFLILKALEENFKMPLERWSMYILHFHTTSISVSCLYQSAILQIFLLKIKFTYHLR